MRSPKQVIQLGLLNDGSNLPSGRKNIYYMYYKSDGDFYMYDSYHDKEYNLFRLQPKPKGTLTILATYVIKGLLEIFSTRSGSGKLSITATRTVLTSNGGDLKVVIKQTPLTKGILIVTATTDIQRGNLRVSVRDGAGSKGILSITSTRDFGKGNIEVHVYDDAAANGNLIITSTRNPAVGNLQVNVREIGVIENGNLIITSTHDFDRGNLQVLIKQP